MSAWGVPNTAPIAPEPVKETKFVPSAAKGGGFSLDDFPTMDLAAASAVGKKDDLLDEYSLGGGGGGGKKGKKGGKKAAQKMTLSDFAEAVGGPVFTQAILPTAPAFREEGEDPGFGKRPGQLGGAFQDYGGDRGGGDRYGDRRGGFERGGGFDREERMMDRPPREEEGPSRADEDKDWGKSKKFVPTSAPPRRGGFDDRDPRDRERGPPREDEGPSRADEADDWGKNKKFVPSDPRDARDPRGGAPRDDLPSRRADDASNWKRSGDSPQLPERDERGPPRSFRADEDRDWKKKENTPPPAGGPPGERRRLQLAPRTKPVEETAAAAEAEGKANPFGGARPVQVKAVEDPEPAPAKELPPPREAPKPRPADTESRWGKKEAPPPPERGGGGRGGGGGGDGERKRLAIKPRSEGAAAAEGGGGGGSSLFGGARPREQALEEKGRDWRKEELELSRINRPESDKEKALKAEVEALRAAGDDAAAKVKEAELTKLCLELDDKVRFSTGKGEKDGKPERGGERGGERGEPREWKDRGPRRDGGGRGGGGRGGGERDVAPPARTTPPAKKAPEPKVVSEDGWEAAKPSRRGKAMPAKETEDTPAVTVTAGGFEGLSDE